VRDKHEIEVMANRAAEAWDNNTDPYLEGWMEALQWVLDREQEDPSFD